ncbi:MAG: hypothetical protein ACJ749_10635, partial [Flavisolibacter sp.]
MPMLTSTIVWRAFATIVCLCLSVLLIAQKRLVDMQRTSTVDVVTKEKIEELRTGNMIDVLRLSPGTNHVNSRTITYDFDNSAADKRTDKIYYDALNHPSYMLSTTTNDLGIPIEAVEELRINKDLDRGWYWGKNTANQWTEVYDNAKNKFVPTDFMAEWKPQLTYIPPDPSTIQVIDHSKWTADLVAERSQSDGSISLPDKTYSSTGKADIKRWKDGNVRIREEKIYDARGVVREYVYRELYPDDYVYEETSYYNCHGEPIYFESTWYDDEDFEIDMIDIVFKDGQPVAGMRDVDDFDPEMGPMQFRQFFNPQSMKFEYLV